MSKKGSSVKNGDGNNQFESLSAGSAMVAGGNRNSQAIGGDAEEIGALKERLRRAKNAAAAAKKERLVLHKIVQKYGVWAAQVFAQANLENAKRDYERCTRIKLSRRSSFWSLLQTECAAVAAAAVGCADPRTQRRSRQSHLTNAATLETSGRSVRQFATQLTPYAVADRRTATATQLTVPFSAHSAAACMPPAAYRHATMALAPAYTTPLTPTSGIVQSVRAAVMRHNPLAAAGVYSQAPAFCPSSYTPSPLPVSYPIPAGGQQYADSRRFVGSGPQAFNPSSTPSSACISSSVASEPALYRPSLPTYTAMNWRRADKRSRQELEEGTVDCTAHKRHRVERAHSREVGTVESSVDVDSSATKRESQ